MSETELLELYLAAKARWLRSGRPADLNGGLTLDEQAGNLIKLYGLDGAIAEVPKMPWPAAHGAKLLAILGEARRRRGAS